MAEDLPARIARHWAALCGARAVASRSPNSETLRVEERCERQVNQLLEDLWRSIPVDKRAEIERRPVRRLVRA